MKKITVEKTVTQQVLDLPIGSVVLVRQNGFDYVLHRTGEDGWLTTRPISVIDRTYLRNVEIRDWLADKEDDVYLLTD